MQIISSDETFKTVTATRVGDILYIEAPKKLFLPAYVYYLLQSKGCTKACFNASKTTYKLEHLKGEEDWKNVDKKRKAI